MKFGKVAQSELESLDLSLPPDHPETSTILNKSEKVKTKVYVGCAKWGRKEWVDLIYPPGTKDKDFLDEYVKNFNAIEMNTTFYSIKKNSVEDWVSRAPVGFKFSPKVNRSITHIKRLNEDAKRYTDYFINTSLLFGQHLGSVFLQLPENFTGKYLDRVADYLEVIPEDYPLFIEMRHESWFSDETASDELFNLLKEKGIGSVITDVAGRRDVLHQRLTTNKAFIRFNGYGLGPTDFKRLDDWASRIKQWMEQGLEEVYFYAHQENEAHTPKTADYFIERINSLTDLKLQRPNFL